MRANVNKIFIIITFFLIASHHSESAMVFNSNFTETENNENLKLFSNTNLIIEEGLQEISEKKYNFLEILKKDFSKNKIATINKINNHFNSRLHIINYELPETYSSKIFNGNFIKRNPALAKYFALRYIGLTADDLKITTIEDKQTGENKTTLIVKIENENYILETSPNIAQIKRIKHYNKLFAINENSFWEYSNL